MSDPTPDEIRAAMALPGWRWVARMQVQTRDGLTLTIVQVGGRRGGSYIGCTATGRAYGWRQAGLPVLDDDATGGALLGLLGSGWCLYRRDHDGWYELSRPDGASMTQAPTLAGACVRVALVQGEWAGGTRD